MQFLRNLIILLKDTIHAWSEDRVPRMAAILAFYSSLSLSPILILSVAIAGAIVGQESIQNDLVNQVSDVFGNEGGQLVRDLIASATRIRLSITASALSLLLIIFGASGIFRHLYESLNLIWHVEPYPDRPGLVRSLIRQGIGVLMVIGMGVMLLASLIAATVVTTIAATIEQHIPGTQSITGLAITLVSLLILSILFVILFKYVPAVQVRWQDILPGAISTALLFLLGENLIALYFRNSSFGSIYGAAGTLVIILLWMYYSAIIVLLGAELTYAYVHRFGDGVQPAEHATMRESPPT